MLPCALAMLTPVFTEHTHLANHQHKKQHQAFLEDLIEMKSLKSKMYLKKARDVVYIYLKAFLSLLVFAEYKMRTKESYSVGMHNTTNTRKSTVIYHSNLFLNIKLLIAHQFQS